MDGRTWHRAACHAGHSRGAAGRYRLAHARIGGEFMPPLDEGDLLFMPTALPGLSAGKAAELLQQTDRLIKTLPEVATVHGKAGRAAPRRDRDRDRDRPGAAGDVRNHHSVQAKKRMAARHDARQTGRGAGPHGQGSRPVQHLGAADSQPHRHAGHRHQEPGGRQGVGCRPGGDSPHYRRD